MPDFGEAIYVHKSISNLGLTHEEIEAYRARLIPAGSVVMSCVGRFGIAAVVSRDCVVNQQLHAFLVPEGISARYLAYVLRSQARYMESEATATTIAYLNKDGCNSVPIPVPPFEEQKMIVAEIENRLSIAEGSAKQIEFCVLRALRLRQSILKRAFEGTR